MPAREAAPRPDLGLPARGDRHRETAGNHQDPTCGDLDGDVEDGTQIETGRLLGLVAGEDCSRIESFESEQRLGHVHRISSPRAAPWISVNH